MDKIQELISQIPEEQLSTYINNLDYGVFYSSDINLSRKKIAEYINILKIVDYKEKFYLKSNRAPNYDKKTWKIFSTKEAVWYSFIEELISFRVSYDEIKRIKEKEFTKFNLVLILSLIYDVDILFYYSNSKFTFITQDELSSEYSNVRESFIIINMKKVYYNFYSNSKIEQSLEYYLGISNPEEVKILNHIAGGDYQHIILSMNNNVTIILEKKRKDWKKIIQDGGRVLKQGLFKSISFISNDGQNLTINISNYATF